MNISDFRNKINTLYCESGMDEFIDWPIVYHEDEKGQIYIDPEGKIYFADECYRWVPTHLSLKDISALRRSAAYDTPGIDITDEVPSESYIYNIYFNSGEMIMLFNVHESFSVQIFLHLKSDLCGDSLPVLQKLYRVSIFEKA